MNASNWYKSKMAQKAKEQSGLEEGNHLPPTQRSTGAHVTKCSGFLWGFFGGEFWGIFARDDQTLGSMFG